jgi:hypothetical protein
MQNLSAMSARLWPQRIKRPRSVRRQGLQQLRRHGHGNHFGRLAGDAGHADGAGHLRQLGIGKAALVQAVAEGGPFAAAADQPDEGQVAALALAAQAGGHHVQVLRHG